MNDYFKKAGGFNDEKIHESSATTNNDTKENNTNITNMSSYFKQADDLDNELTSEKPINTNPIIEKISNYFFQFRNQNVLLQARLLNGVGNRCVLQHHFTNGRFDYFEPAIKLDQLVG